MSIRICQPHAIHNLIHWKSLWEPASYNINKQHCKNACQKKKEKEKKTTANISCGIWTSPSELRVKDILKTCHISKNTLELYLAFMTSNFPKIRGKKTDHVDNFFSSKDLLLGFGEGEEGVRGVWVCVCIHSLYMYPDRKFCKMQFLNYM